MGTGSVATRFLRLLSLCRRCLSPFSDGERRTTVEKGDRHLAARFVPDFQRLCARSQSPFSTNRLQFEIVNARTHRRRLACYPFERRRE